MTPHLFYVTDQPLASGTDIIVSGDEGHHGVAVRRLRVGEKVTLSDGHGNVIEGQVTQIPTKSQFVVVGTLRSIPLDNPAFSLCVAEIRPERLESAIESLTELGADSLRIFRADNSRTRGLTLRNQQRLTRRVYEASKQSRRPSIPEISFHDDVLDAVGWEADREKVIVADELATRPLPGVQLGGARTVTVVTGPEGGFSERERAALASVDADFVRLGSTILRAGTAGAAALSWLLGASGRWR